MKVSIERIFFLSNGFREIHVNPQIGVRLNIEIISGDELTRYMVVPHYPQEKNRENMYTLIARYTRRVHVWGHTLQGFDHQTRWVG